MIQTVFYSIFVVVFTLFPIVGRTQQEEKNRLQNTSVEEVEKKERDKGQDRYKAKMKDAYLNQPVRNAENYWVEYTSSARSDQKVNALQQAYKLAPDDRRIAGEMAGYYIRTQQKNAAAPILSSLVEQNFLTGDQLLYGQDILKAVPLDGILICNGFDDTYAVMQQQVNHQFRTDVKVMSLDWLLIPDYRKSLERSGYFVPESKSVDALFLSEFVNRNPEYNIGISLSVPVQYTRQFKEKVISGPVVLVTGGVSHSFVMELFDNLELIREKEVDEKTKRWSANYLPYLFAYRKRAQQEGKTDKVKEVEQLIRKISTWIDEAQRIEELLK